VATFVDEFDRANAATPDNDWTVVTGNVRIYNGTAVGDNDGLAVRDFDNPYEVGFELLPPGQRVMWVDTGTPTPAPKLVLIGDAVEENPYIYVDDQPFTNNNYTTITWQRRQELFTQFATEYLAAVPDGLLGFIAPGAFMPPSNDLAALLTGYASAGDTLADLGQYMQVGAAYANNLVVVTNGVELGAIQHATTTYDASTYSSSDYGPPRERLGGAAQATWRDYSGAALDVADQLKADGVEIFAIGLSAWIGTDLSTRTVGDHAEAYIILRGGWYVWTVAWGYLLAEDPSAFYENQFLPHVSDDGSYDGIYYSNGPYYLYFRAGGLIDYGTYGDGTATWQRSNAKWNSQVFDFGDIVDRVTWTFVREDDVQIGNIPFGNVANFVFTGRPFDGGQPIVAPRWVSYVYEPFGANFLSVGVSGYAGAQFEESVGVSKDFLDELVSTPIDDHELINPTSITPFVTTLASQDESSFTDLDLNAYLYARSAIDPENSELLQSYVFLLVASDVEVLLFDTESLFVDFAIQPLQAHDEIVLRLNGATITAFQRRGGTTLAAGSGTGSVMAGPLIGFAPGPWVRVERFFARSGSVQPWQTIVG